MVLDKPGVILILIVAMVVVIVVVELMKSKEGYHNLTYYKCDKYPINNAMNKIFKEQGIEKAKSIEEADIYLTCGYTNVEKEYDNMHIDKKKYIHAIKGCDNIVAKDSLWKLMEKRYGRKEAINYVPNTYLLNAIEDKLELLRETENKIFIFKKNAQRQEGLQFSTRKELTVPKINELAKENYVIVQEYLDDPFLINGRKVNMRVYLLIVIKNGVKYGYIYTDGFMYYTKKGYKYSTDPDEGITTGYIDRKIYKQNPLTHSDLRGFLIHHGYNYKLLFNNIQDTIVKVLDAVEMSLKATKGEVNYQLFGIDVQPDKNLNVKLIEINKGADMSAKDPRDSELKYKLQEDIYKTIGIIKETYDNDFVLVWKK